MNYFKANCLNKLPPQFAHLGTENLKDKKSNNKIK